MYKTRQEQARAELAKKQKAERKNAPMSTAQLDNFLFTQGRKTGLLDGYKGPDVVGDQLGKFLSGKF